MLNKIYLLLFRIPFSRYNATVSHTSTFRMPPHGKRTSDFIDLTSEDEPVCKQARISHPHSHSLSSSQPRPSQSLTDTPPSTHINSRDQWAVPEENEIIDLSQDIDEGVEWTVLGSLDGKIVGIQYYHGYATPGEQVMVKREPGNPYDSNAIRVNNVQGTQIGHLPRVLAGKLAPYLVRFPPLPFVVVEGERARLIAHDRIQGSLSLRLFLLVRKVVLIVQCYSKSLVPLSQL